MKRMFSLFVCIIAIGFLLSGCSRRQHEWETARSADTVEAYEQFLKSFPDGEFASQAQARVQELHEAQDWQSAAAIDTPAAYEEFLKQYPQGRMSDEARIRVENFALAQTPSGASQELPPGAAPGTATDLPAAVQPSTAAKSPAPAVSAATAKSKAATALATAHPAGGYRIQLGAFSGGDKQAMGEWRRLQRENPALLAGLTPSVKLATTSAGHLYRLQAGITNEARAREICAALKKKSQACVLVLP